jgi:hypothetical protein
MAKMKRLICVSPRQRSAQAEAHPDLAYRIPQKMALDCIDDGSHAAAITVRDMYVSRHLKGQSPPAPVFTWVHMRGVLGRVQGSP